MSILIDKETIIKHDIPGPRYTSYPTAPVWNDSVTQKEYIDNLKKFGLTDKTLSLYLHVPFCESMCTYCACNVIIRKKDRKYADEYLRYMEKEMGLMARYIGRRKTIRQLHWGGGTPTFLEEDQMDVLFSMIQKYFDIDFSGEIAIEIDPRTVSESKMKKLKSIGFNRISMGVQDFDLKVQQAINRIQPFEMVERYTELCRKLGFQSLNFDLIYGLPNQTVESFQKTIEKVIQLKPDRIALYSFAYVPWLKKHQEKIDKSALPSNEAKLDIFLYAREALLKSSYDAIAMDHFAVKEDELAKAFRQGSLYRNFMGYTVKPADEYLGLGVTSIGFMENMFIQNHKVLSQYYEMLDQNQLPMERGKVLTLDDCIRQWTINSLMCRFGIDKKEFYSKFSVNFDAYFSAEKNHIDNCAEDHLLEVNENELRVTELGKIFIRNVCMGFDYYLHQKDAHTRFSRTI